MQLITDLWNYITSIPLDTWSHIGGYLIASGAIATTLQVVKNRLHIDGKKLITSLLAGFSLLASLAEYLVTNNPGAPLPEIGSLWAYVMAGAVIIHRFAVSPAYARLTAAWHRFAEQVATYKTERYAPAPTVAALAPADPERPAGFAE